ncbi:MAG: hypothetical protein AAGA99_05635 [Actinomycetota bacterium]
MRRILFLLIGVTLVLAACGDSDDTGDETASDDAPATTDAPVDGPLDVAQLLEQQPDGVVDVTGLLFVDESGPRMCELTLESFPPQCGGAVVFLVDLDINAVAGTQTEQGITWKDPHVASLQRIDDTSYRVVQEG